MQEPQTKAQKASLRLAILERTIELVTAAFSLVAALAWNDAIQSLFRTIFGDVASLYAKIAYALIVTIVTVILVTRLTRIAKLLKNEAER